MGDEVFYYAPHPESEAEQAAKLKQKVEESRSITVFYTLAILAAFITTGLLYWVMHYFKII